MAKQKPVIKLQTYGIYEHWDSKSKALPTIKTFTTDIPAEIDIEFGLTVNIKHARGNKIFYCIDHPNISNKEGQLCAAFTGEVQIKNNDWDFYLGDTIWAPIDDKCGPWRMTIELNKKIVVDKTFHVFTENKNVDFKKRFSYM
ncbi:DUF3859 domain-containing protein [Psychromonas sp. PT13]|uniref:DUF3859 domain-containing protein n=1 Tax=Psychromonas sp. PT13 TaxID=3439547 RepID=UPI003EC15655